MRISDWSSDVCSSDLLFTFVQQIVRESGYEDLLASGVVLTGGTSLMPGIVELAEDVFLKPVRVAVPDYEGSLADVMHNPRFRSEEHTSELQSLMRISYAVFCLTKNKNYSHISELYET